MKTILIATVALALTAPMVLATGSGGKPSSYELAKRICGNNGGGNDGEYIRFDRKKKTWVCIKNRGSERHDVDPN